MSGSATAYQPSNCENLTTTSSDVPKIRIIHARSILLLPVISSPKITSPIAALSIIYGGPAQVKRTIARLRTRYTLICWSLHWTS